MLEGFKKQISRWAKKMKNIFKKRVKQIKDKE